MPRAKNPPSGIISMIGVLIQFIGIILFVIVDDFHKSIGLIAALLFLAGIGLILSDAYRARGHATPGDDAPKGGFF